MLPSATPVTLTGPPVEVLAKEAPPLFSVMLVEVVPPEITVCEAVTAIPCPVLLSKEAFVPESISVAVSAPTVPLKEIPLVVPVPVNAVPVAEAAAFVTTVFIPAPELNVLLPVVAEMTLLPVVAVTLLPVPPVILLVVAAVITLLVLLVAIELVPEISVTALVLAAEPTVVAAVPVVLMLVVPVTVVVLEALPMLVADAPAVLMLVTPVTVVVPRIVLVEVPEPIWLLEAPTVPILLLEAAPPIMLTAPLAVKSPVTVVPVAVSTATLFAPPVIVVLVKPVMVLVAPVTMLVDTPTLPMVFVEACVVPILLTAPFRLALPDAVKVPVTPVFPTIATPAFVKVALLVPPAMDD